MRTRTNRIGIFSVIGLFIFCSSCQGVNTEKLREYIDEKDNGLIINHQSEYAMYTMQFRPNALCYIYEAKSNATQNALNKYIEANRNTSTFTLDIKFNQKTLNAQKDYSTIKQAYQNELNANYIKLIEGDKEFPCIIYHCEIIGKGNYKINLVFPKGAEEIKDNWIIQFYDVVTGDEPTFSFTQENIKNIPTLKL